MAIEHENTHTIYTERRSEHLISPKTGTHTIGSARFLKPLAKNTQFQSVKPPKSPLLHQVFAKTDRQWPESGKIQFKGCRYPQKKWEDWVEKLSVRYGSVWEKAGICDAIMTSVYEIRFNKQLVLGLAEFWCVETNTFTFPWGEASITLDDLYVLAGLPVVGKCSVTRPLASGDSLKTLNKLEMARSLICKGRDRKASFSGWMSHFFGDLAETDVDHELEHVAFLALWLSRYVFTSLPDDTIASNVFPIAIRLARGTSIALAPAVLAAIYQDLRLLTEKAKRSKVGDSIVIAGLFQLVQLWAFEHFPLLAPDSSNSLRPGEPRVARWAKLNSKITLPLVRSVLKLSENFEWRPFAVDVKNWRHSSFYEDEEVQYRTLSMDSDEDDGLLSFVKCVCPCELVGLDGNKEKYMPHHVAMQFGFDQDVPGPFSLVNCKMVSFFVPARTYQPGVSAGYLNWWKESKRGQEDLLATNNNIPKVKPSPRDDYSKVKPSPQVDYSFLNREYEKVDAGSNVSRKPHPQASRKHDLEVLDHERHASTTPKVTNFKPTNRSYNKVDDEDDHISLSARLNKSIASTNTKPLLKPHSSAAKKRKFYVSEDLEKQFDKTDKWVSDECNRKPGYAKDVPVEIDCSSDEDIIKKDQSSKRSGVAAEYVQTFRETNYDLEGRVKMLEKMLGLRS